MTTQFKTPTRATLSKSSLAKSGPPLEVTLRYLIILLSPDFDIKNPDKVGKNGEGWGEGWAKQAKALGLELRRFQRFLPHPSFETAREVAAKHRSARVREKTFGAYVFKHLSAESRETWKELKFWAEHANGQVQIQKIMSGRAKKIRQELFIHALVSTHFDMSSALRLTGLSKMTLQTWKQDLQFAQLMEEVQWHKKNFFEKAMMDLVADRNPLATIWVNKTVNADRGYSEKIQVQHSISDAGFSFEDLDLDTDTRRKVLEAIRKRQALQAGANGQPKLLRDAEVVDVEAESVEEEVD